MLAPRVAGELRHPLPAPDAGCTPQGYRLYRPRGPRKDSLHGQGHGRTESRDGRDARRACCAGGCSGRTRAAQSIELAAPTGGQRDQGIAGVTSCAQCGVQFRPERSTARFCGDRCRVANARYRVSGTSRAGRAPAGAVLSVTGAPPSTPAIKPPPATPVTLTIPISRASKPAPLTLDPRIVPDTRWPGMYRFRRPERS